MNFMDKIRERAENTNLRLLWRVENISGYGRLADDELFKDVAKAAAEAKSFDDIKPEYQEIIKQSESNYREHMELLIKSREKDRL